MLAYALAAFFSAGYFHFDEHYQILEFAGYKLGVTPYDQLTWEYEARIRPTLQPVLVMAVWNGLDLLGLANPFWVVTLLRFLSAGLSLVATWQLIRLYQPEISYEPLRQWLAPLSLLAWMVVFNHVRFSSENWSGIFFLMAYCLLLALPNAKPGRYLAAGALLGLSFVCRYQSAFLIAGLGVWLWLMRRDPFWKLSLMTVSALAVAGLGILLDSWFYGELTVSAWHYFEQNLIHGKAAEYGVFPWWFYFQSVFLNLIPPFSLVYLGGWLLVNRYEYKSALVWTTLPFLIIHFIIGHKEGRFLFPILSFGPVFIVWGLDLWARRKPAVLAFIRGAWGHRLSRIFWYANLLGLAVVCLKPIDDQNPIYHFLYDQYPQTTTLYLVKGDPYKTFAHVRFYKRSTLQVVEVDDLQQIPAASAGNTQLVMTSNPGRAKTLAASYPQVFSSFPNWVRYFNFNGWLDRTPFWRLYQLNP